MSYVQDTQHVKDFIHNNYAALENKDWRMPTGRENDSQSFEEWYGQLPCRTMYVNGYEQGQGYGGPEEGGWWYSTREPVASIPVTSLKEALVALTYMEEFLRDMYEHERPYYSAAGGADGYAVCENRFAYPEPNERPRYE